MSKQRAIRAAGVVVLRAGKAGFEVALVHRPKYDDWSLPKGKPTTDEPMPVTAVREVEEETGMRVRLGMPLDLIRYRTDKGPKEVFFWVSRHYEQGTFTPNAEIDEVAWLPLDEAGDRLSYDDEGPLLVQAANLPETTPFLLVRHGKAMQRKHWSGSDAKRPIDARGRKQASRLIPLLSAYGVQHVLSSTSTRCVQTLQPYAKSRDLSIETISRLSEEEGADHPDEVRDLVERLTRGVAKSGTPAAVCGHRPVIPAMLDGLGLPERPMQTSASCVVHVDSAGTTVAVEWHARPA